MSYRKIDNLSIFIDFSRIFDSLVIIVNSFGSCSYRIGRGKKPESTTVPPQHASPAQGIKFHRILIEVLLAVIVIDAET